MDRTVDDKVPIMFSCISVTPQLREIFCLAKGKKTGILSETTEYSGAFGQRRVPGRGFVF